MMGSLGRQELRELVGERFDDVVDAVRHAYERANDWKTFYGIAPFAERYLRKERDVHLHLWFRRLRVHLANLCVRFEPHPALEPDGCGIELDRDEGRPPQPTVNDGDESVLIGIVQFMKKPKGAGPIPIPSLVRLKRLNACGVGWPPPKVGQHIPVESRASPAVRSDDKDREACALALTEPPITTGVGPDRELTDQAVERGTEVVRDLPDKDRPRSGNGGRLPNPQHVQSCLSVEFSNADSVEVLVKKPLALVLERFDLLTGADDLELRAIKRVRRHV